jgi:hypothetical protein
MEDRIRLGPTDECARMIGKDYQGVVLNLRALCCETKLARRFENSRCPTRRDLPVQNMLAVVALRGPLLISLESFEVVLELRHESDALVLQEVRGVRRILLSLKQPERLT